MSDEFKELLKYIGLGALWAVGIVGLLAIGAALLVGPVFLASMLHNPGFYWLYLVDIPVIGAAIGAYLWFEDNA